MSEVNIIVNSENKIFDIYSKLYGINYKVLVSAKNFKFLTDKVPMEIMGNYYFKNCNIRRIGGKNIHQDYNGGDVLEIEVKKTTPYKNIIDGN